MKRTLTLVAVMLSAGCAFGPGEPFATLTPSLNAQLHLPPGRGNPSPLANDYVVHITRFDVRYTEARLIQLGDTSASGFDPANPPDGYTICHNGHCDREDGALISYQEVAAGLPGGAGSTELAHVVVGTANQLGEVRPLECEGSCELAASTVNTVKLGVANLTIEGEVHDARLVKRFDGVRPFVIDYVAPADTELSADVDIDVTRHSSPKVALELQPLLGPALLDNIEFSGPLSSNEVNRQLTESLVTSKLSVAVQR